MTSLSTTSLKPQKREMMVVDEHGIGDRCLISSPTGSRQKNIVSKTKNNVEKLHKKCCQKKPLNECVTPPPTFERVMGSLEQTNLEGRPIPGLVQSPIASESDNGYVYTMDSPTNGQDACSKGLHPRPQAHPSNKEDSHIGTTHEVVMAHRIHDPEVDFNSTKGGSVRQQVKELLELFRGIHKQFNGGHKDKEVFQIIVECFSEHLVNGTESLYGNVPGVEVGDIFYYRAEMDLVGLHHKQWKGIDFIAPSKSKRRLEGKPVGIATCIVVAGGYVDNQDEGDVIIYTGEGGNNVIYDHKGPSKDQMLTNGNKALRHSLILSLYVRVVRKIDVKSPTKPYYRYDGLYKVIDMKKERSRGSQRGFKRKASSFEDDGENHKVGKCQETCANTLVYKFLLVRKSAKEKYKNVNFENLWTFQP